MRDHSSRSYPHCPAGVSRESRRIIPSLADEGHLTASLPARPGRSRSRAASGGRRAAHCRSPTLAAQITGEHSIMVVQPNPVALNRERRRSQNRLGRAGFFPFVGRPNPTDGKARPTLQSRLLPEAADISALPHSPPPGTAPARALGPEWILPCQTQLETETGGG